MSRDPKPGRPTIDSSMIGAFASIAAALITVTAPLILEREVHEDPPKPAETKSAPGEPEQTEPERISAEELESTAKPAVDPEPPIVRDPPPVEEPAIPVVPPPIPRSLELSLQSGEQQTVFGGRLSVGLGLHQVAGETLATLTTHTAQAGSQSFPFLGGFQRFEIEGDRFLYIIVVNQVDWQGRAAQLSISRTPRSEKKTR